MKETKHERIARYLRGQLAERCLKNIEVAQALGMSTSVFSRKITGKVPFTVNEVDAVIDYLGLTWSEVAQRTD